ncbi:MAG: DUF3576 domain-containing protein [Alphaproteobacteria bacterium]
MTGTILRARGFVRLAGVLLLTGAGGCQDLKAVYPTKDDKNQTSPVYRAPTEDAKRDTIFGPGGLSFGGRKTKTDESGGGGIGVNSFLWRAALDTIAFMPLSSADPFGGVIITDWYSPPDSPGERFKVNIYILSKALRSDGLRVSAFRQVRGSNGEWTEAPVHVATDMENAVLTKARQLRMATTEP